MSKKEFRINRDETAGEVNINKVMLTKKFIIGEKVRISRETTLDRNGKEILEKERDLDFIVTHKYDNDLYFIAKGDFKHKLGANEIAKVVK